MTCSVKRIRHFTLTVCTTGRKTLRRWAGSAGLTEAARVCFGTVYYAGRASD